MQETNIKINTLIPYRTIYDLKLICFDLLEIFNADLSLLVNVESLDMIYKICHFIDINYNYLYNIEIMNAMECAYENFYDTLEQTDIFKNLSENFNNATFNRKLNFIKTFDFNMNKKCLPIMYSAIFIHIIHNYLLNGNLEENDIKKVIQALIEENSLLEKLNKLFKEENTMYNDKYDCFNFYVNLKFFPKLNNLDDLKDYLKNMNEEIKSNKNFYILSEYRFILEKIEGLDKLLGNKRGKILNILKNSNFFDNLNDCIKNIYERTLLKFDNIENCNENNLNLVIKMLKDLGYQSDEFNFEYINKFFNLVGFNIDDKSNVQYVIHNLSFLGYKFEKHNKELYTKQDIFLTFVAPYINISMFKKLNKRDYSFGDAIKLAKQVKNFPYLDCNSLEDIAEKEKQNIDEKIKKRYARGVYYSDLFMYAMLNPNYDVEKQEEYYDIQPELDINVVIENIYNIPAFKSYENISFLINGLTKIYMVDGEVDDVIKEKCISCINYLLDKFSNLEEEFCDGTPDNSYNVEARRTISNEIKNSLNLNLFYLQKVACEKIKFPDNFPIIRDYSTCNDEHILTDLEETFKNLIEGCSKNQCNGEMTIETEKRTSYGRKNDIVVFEHNTDFYINNFFSNKGIKYELYIEIDGPCHFLSEKEDKKNLKTIMRDKTLDFYCFEYMDSRNKKKENKNIAFITISANEINGLSGKMREKYKSLKSLISTKINLFEERRKVYMKEKQQRLEKANNAINGQNQAVRN